MSLKSVIACSAALSLLAQSWQDTVNSVVPDPYLDEVFHIPQAQAYCKGNFRQWDPKLTTPPGLYVFNWLGNLLFKIPCETGYLRFTNAAVWSLVITISLLFFFTSKTDAAASRIRALHTTCNVFFFPPLFFFFALYYTDAASTGLVILSFAVSRIRNPSSPTLIEDARTFLCGALALTFRQTNIFWVAVFPAGLDVVTALKAAQSVSTTSYSHGIENGLSDILTLSYRGLLIYDPFVNEASLADYLIMVLSVLVAAVSNYRIILRATLPYLLLSVSFAGFLAWNGGVVLGDKSNHIATLHLPQLLYLFAYMTFFSFPLMIPRLLASIVPPRFLPSIFEPYISASTSLPRVISVISFSAVSLLVVRFNTIIHPFTLADNRHYVFYVFRILRLYPILKYLAAPVFVICGWAVIQTLAIPSPSALQNVGSRRGSTQSTPGVSRASTFSSGSDTNAQENHPHLADRGHSEQRRSSSVIFPPSKAGDQLEQQRLSLAVLWLLACFLNLVTAPLVEPRYFILPWIFWRIHVPSPDPGPFPTPPLNPSASDTDSTSVGSQSGATTTAAAAAPSPAGAFLRQGGERGLRTTPAGPAGSQAQGGRSSTTARRRKPARPPPPPIPWRIRLAYYVRCIDSRLFAETAWFLVVNTAVAYMFLNRGFEWPQEPGRTQRFMW